MDILSPALSLEDTYYTEGLTLGRSDGAKAGLVEGRRFGLEKAFDKFASIGHLHGRSIIWNTRAQLSSSGPEHEIAETNASTEANHSKDQHTHFLPQLRHSYHISQDNANNNDQVPDELRPPAGTERIEIPRFPEGTSHSHSRLKKHAVTLYALTELDSLSLENNEEAVSEFDDRYRRAVAKAAIIGRIVGERVDGGDGNTDAGTGLPGGKESSGDGGWDERKNGKGEPEMEDIVGLRRGSDRDKGRGSDDQDGQDGLEIEIR